ncbi:MAG: MBL fold metallo-hydrolase [Eudoraea sp.]|nr:MBL fold metallo-hydrolase [Eudoraea sp.]
MVKKEFNSRFKIMNMKYILTFVFLWVSCQLMAQRNFDTVEITSEKLTENIYVLYGAGGNMGLAVGDEYAYLIDDQFAPLSEKIQAAIAKITTKPLRFLINTHWHGDHVGGNKNFAEAGAIILANENVHKRMSTPQERRGQMTEPSPYKALPQITYTDAVTLYLNENQSMHIMHVNDSHTDGDSFVYFPESNVIHMGDNFPNGYPYIDLESGGNIDGLIKNLGMALAIVDNDTQIIRGHGKVAKKAQLEEYRTIVQTIRDRVAAAIEEGKTLEAILSLGVSKEWDAEYGQGFISGPAVTTSIYNSLKKK